MGQSVLLIEDDARVRHVLRLALQDEGYRVAEAATAGEGMSAMAHGTPDVVLIDVMLPDMDGFALCREIRRDTDVPVIMVTARTDSHDVVAGLEAGADDYVTKPVVAKELSARIRALTRRVNHSQRTKVGRIRAGDLEIIPEQGVVRRHGDQLQLTRTEFRLLVELAQADGSVCSRDDLRERVWGYGYFGDSRVVDVHIRRLRLKVERDPGNPRHVVTVRGLGYRLAS